MDLRLAVKREYFEGIVNGNKLEEYRLCNEYWTKRLVGKEYDTVTITLGYPSKEQIDRIATFKWQGYKRKIITHKHFNNKPVEVFAIRLY